MNILSKVIKLYKKCARENLIFVYQMGKVGSSSIRTSLLNIGVDFIYNHSFKYTAHIEPLFKNYDSLYRYIPKKSYIKRLRKLFMKIVILQRLKNKKNKIKIITMTREPISRNISMYFQDFQIPLFDITKKVNHTSNEEFGLKALINDYLENFNHYQGINWFDNEIKETFGIDVYDYDFDKTSGYGIIKHKNIEVLVLKLEKMDSLESVIADFIGNKEFKLFNDNQSNLKWYSSVYKQFKDEITFDEKFIDNIYGSVHMKHFYTDEEIKKYKSKYLRSTSKK